MILGTNRHRSKPDHPTPWNFMSAVTLRVGDVAIDLAATMKDRKAEGFISPKENSLKQDWTKLLNGELGYLNPPFDIAAWADKCIEEDTDLSKPVDQSEQTRKRSEDAFTSL